MVARWLDGERRKRKDREFGASLGIGIEYASLCKPYMQVEKCQLFPDRTQHITNVPENAFWLFQGVGDG